jgi:hypothetical protein
MTRTLPSLVTVLVTNDTVSVDRADGRTSAVPMGWYPRLAQGTPAERTKRQMRGAGEGVQWPALDEDIGIEGLLMGKPTPKSLRSYVAPALGRGSPRALGAAPGKNPAGRLAWPSRGVMRFVRCRGTRAVAGAHPLWRPGCEEGS